MTNAFNILGDFLHLSAMILLIVKFLRTKSCANISGKTQILFAIAFTMRYLDFYSPPIPYYIVMKCVYVALTYLFVFMIYGPLKKTYDRENDGMYNEFLVVPCFVLALYLSDVSAPSEILWTFSIFLEAVAIVPQLDLLCNIDFIDNYSIGYLVLLGLYPVKNILNWAYLYHYEGFYLVKYVFTSFLMTTLFALVFVRLYILKRRDRKLMIAVVG
ncbi:ER lumen protein-retaining receptor 3-like [Ochlerotatus camptorhynchus]|uniref:ER lumen protein-retaining receptor 3-like n=1 Tax=Ochlerotatus camptorhynchus TaxID=644619 RepID=UPI0031D2DC6E